MKCYYDCRKRKRYTINAAQFEICFESELAKLQKELTEHTYCPGRSICFIVTKPKVREIFAADFRDRIVHHVLVDYLESIWEHKFIDQSYACRKHRGAHCAIRDLKRYIRKASLGGKQKVYYLQSDVKSFFVSLNKNILFEILKSKTKNSEVLWLAEVLIFHVPTKNYFYKGQPSLFDLVPDNKSLFKVPLFQGLPIGNLTSQFFANVYLNRLDHYSKHVLKIRYYMRYVDDILILSNNMSELILWQRQIDMFLRKMLKLELHPDKQILRSINEGIDFLGFVVRPEYVLARRRIVKSLKHWLWTTNQNLKESDSDNINRILSTVNSYYGQLKHSNTFGLRNKLWNENFNNLRKFIRPVDKNFSHFEHIPGTYG